MMKWSALLISLVLITACGRIANLDYQEVIATGAHEPFHPLKKEPVDVTRSCVKCY